MHHDNALAHVSHLICSFLAKHKATILPHLPYAPELAPADFFLLPKLKATLKIYSFQTKDEIDENSYSMTAVTIHENLFQATLKKMKTLEQYIVNTRDKSEYKVVNSLIKFL